MALRFATFDDFPLVEEIEKLFQKNTDWAVAESENDPKLRPNPQFKVVVSASLDIVDRLHSFLSMEDGRLLGVPVGLRRLSNDGRVTIESLADG